MRCRRSFGNGAGGIRAKIPHLRNLPGSPGVVLLDSALAAIGVQLSILGLNLVYAALGVILMYASYRIIDRLTPEVDFPAELKRGNVAVAIFIAALFLSIALIVGRAIG